MLPCPPQCPRVGRCPPVVSPGWWRCSGMGEGHGGRGAGGRGGPGNDTRRVPTVLPGQPRPCLPVQLRVSTGGTEDGSAEGEPRGSPGWLCRACGTPHSRCRVNVGCGPAEQRLLLTGLHSVADIFCQSCNTTLGWKYVSAPQLRPPPAASTARGPQPLSGHPNPFHGHPRAPQVPPGHPNPCPGHVLAPQSLPWAPQSLPWAPQSLPWALPGTPKPCCGHPQALGKAAPIGVWGG